MPDAASRSRLPEAPTRPAQAADRPAYLIVLPWDLSYAGGVNEVVRNLLRRITADRSWRPTLLVSSWEHRRPVIEDADGVVLIRARMQNPFWHLGSPIRMAKALLALPRSLQRLHDIVSRHRVGVVNLHYANPDVWSFILLRRLTRQRFSLILSFHGMDIEGIRSSSPTGRRLWRRALAECDGLVCCSGALARELEEVEPAVRGRVTVIHNGIDPQAVSTELSAAQLPGALADRRYIACIATFEHKKGLDVLVRAFARLAREIPDIDLVLAGRSDTELAAIRTLADELRLSDRIHILTDLPHATTLRITSGARVFALASRREPFGIVLLEAAVLGVPVVATNVGGIPEIVHDGRTGRLVPPEDEQALAGAISTALRDEIGSRRMAEALRARALADFSWNESFAKYRALALGRPA